MLNFEELDHEFMTEGNPDAEAEKMAGLIEQNLTPEEQARLKEMMPILEEYNMLMVKVQTGNTVEELDNLGALEALGVPSREELGTDTPQEGQMQREAPSRPAQREVPQNAPEMMAEGGKIAEDNNLEKAKAIVKEKYPVQAKHLDDLNVVFVPNMSGHSEYLSPLYDDSKKYNNEATIEINPEFSNTPEQIASTIAGETLHHMKDFDDGFRNMWKSFRQKVDKDDVFKNVQRKRQRTMNTMRQGEYIRGMAQDPRGKKSPYDDTKDVDKFIDASALDEYIRAYNFYDDPIAGKHYDEGWKNDQFFKKYKFELEGFKKYLNPPEFVGMALGDRVPSVIQENVEPTGNPGDVAAGPVGMVDAPGADNSGVADDVPTKSDGFVINAAAVKHAGLKDVNEMIQSAKEYAEQKGIKLNFGKTPTGAEDILVSNGEVVVPDALANIIGYDKLEKINNRGKKETEEKLAAQEEGAPPEGPPTDAPAAPPVLQDQMSGLT